MSCRKWVERGIACCLIAFGAAAAASASTFGRAGLDYLVAENELIVAGEVVDAKSYWNETATLIVTEVRLAVSDVLKGKLEESEVTVMVPGGTIGDRTNLVVGGAELETGRSYVVFLRRGDLPGPKGTRMVSDHCPGVFEIQMGKDGLRAVSQAVRHALVPDGAGQAEALGGAEGLPFNAMKQSVRERVQRGGRKEAK
jgi:hypothetical protein